MPDFVEIFRGWFWFQWLYDSAIFFHYFDCVVEQVTLSKKICYYQIVFMFQLINKDRFSLFGICCRCRSAPGKRMLRLDYGTLGGVTVSEESLGYLEVRSYKESKKRLTCGFSVSHFAESDSLVLINDE